MLIITPAQGCQASRGGGGGGGGVEPGGTWQGKPPDEVTTNNPDESQRSLSEVTRCDIILKHNHHIEIFFSRALMGPAW